jgi:hypothetical protein
MLNGRRNWAFSSKGVTDFSLKEKVELSLWHSQQTLYRTVVLKAESQTFCPRGGRQLDVSHGHWFWSWRCCLRGDLGLSHIWDACFSLPTLFSRADWVLTSADGLFLPRGIIAEAPAQGQAHSGSTWAGLEKKTGAGLVAIVPAATIRATSSRLKVTTSLSLSVSPAW